MSTKLVVHKLLIGGNINMKKKLAACGTSKLMFVIYIMAKIKWISERLQFILNFKFSIEL